MTFDVGPPALATCQASPVWLWYQRIGFAVALLGGLVMLVGAAAIHDTASIPLLAIGGGWLLMGLVGGRQSRRTARRMTFDGTLLRFSMANGEREVALVDVQEFRRPRYDLNRFGPMQAITRSGTYLVMPRCRGLIDFFVALKIANPDIKLPD